MIVTRLEEMEGSVAYFILKRRIERPA